MDKWQPIETAPKDGSMLLVYGRPFSDDGQGYAKAAHVAWWEDSDECWTPQSHAAWTEPTHWMPLPEPPTDAGEEQ